MCEAAPPTRTYYPPKMARNPTKMERAVIAMMEVFNEEKGTNEKLTRRQFLFLLQKEMPSFTELTKDRGDEIFKDVDLDEDRAVDFTEFSLMVARYAWTHYDLLQPFIKALAEDEPPIHVFPPGPQVCPPGGRGFNCMQDQMDYPIETVPVKYN